MAERRRLEEIIAALERQEARIAAQLATLRHLLQRVGATLEREPDPVCRKL